MKKQTNAKARTYKGMSFRSGTEVTMYKLLERSKIPFAYEAQKFTIDEGFQYNNKSYEKFMNGKGRFKDRGKKDFPPAIYTPDFTPPVGEPLKWVIEVKGRSFPDFPRTWRLFKKLIHREKWGTTLFLPRTEEDCKTVIEIIKRDLM